MQSWNSCAKHPQIRRAKIWTCKFMRAQWALDSWIKPSSLKLIQTVAPRRPRPFGIAECGRQSCTEMRHNYKRSHNVTISGSLRHIEAARDHDTAGAVGIVLVSCFVSCSVGSLHTETPGPCSVQKEKRSRCLKYQAFTNQTAIPKIYKCNRKTAIPADLKFGKSPDGGIHLIFQVTTIFIHELPQQRFPSFKCF